MKIEVVTEGLHTLQADCLIIGILKDSNTLPVVLSEVDQAMGGTLASLFAAGEISGKKKETQIIHTMGKIAARRIMFAGLGDKDELSFEGLREAGARAVKEALKANLTSLAFFFGEAAGTLASGEVAHAIVEGALLANYRFPGYHKETEDKPALQSVTVVSSNETEEEAKEGVRIGEVYANGTNLARDLVNMPGNYLTPTVLAEKAKEVAERHGMEVEILEQKDMENYGMGGLLGVNQAR